MQFANHHAHSHFSDGRLSPEDYLQEALRQGLHTYGFSDHAPIPNATFGAMKLEKLSDYLQEIDRLKEQYRGKIEVYKSLEVDYIPGLISPGSAHIQAAQLDYTIGAVHFVGQFADGLYWGFEHSRPHFEKGVREIYGGDYQLAMQTYYGLIRTMVQEYRPTIVAHLDRIKKWNRNGEYYDENSDWYQAEVVATLELIAQSGAILEVNTKGYYSQETVEPYPGKWALAKAHEMNIPVHLSSDAHHPDNITKGFEFGAALLQEVGYNTYQVLLEGVWQPIAWAERKVYAL
ncbi:MAG TPA: histidinol-phosphatase [Saprospiraceae bacterium]|nr:histidinol-phosphatase [Saprospiraceae bacterium]HMQ81662.1 histidinol-phosphatase [Saprospiraceae bacterium]